jgi:hypothetical protein
MTSILATWEVKIKSTVVQGQPGQRNQDPISKIPNTQKRAGGKVQMAEFLHSKCEALS